RASSFYPDGPPPSLHHSSMSRGHSSPCYGEELRVSLLVAALCVLAVFGWQALVVHYDYGGNWTGLYCIGDRFARPPQLHEPLWLFSSSYGYDGQWYHLI